jgi:hypothetical protein
MAGAGPPSRGGAACDHCPDEPCLCASIYDRRTAFIRVRWPRPCALNHSSTSVSTLKCTEALFGGMMTFAVRQKSSSTWRLGASARVVVRPAARFSRSSSSEYRLISSLAIFIDFPRAHYAPDITTPCERDEEVVVVDTSQGAIPPLAVFDAEILCFEDRTRKDQCRVGKVHPVAAEVLAPLLLIPFNGDCHVYTDGYTMSNPPAPGLLAKATPSGRSPPPAPPAPPPAAPPARGTGCTRRNPAQPAGRT